MNRRCSWCGVAPPGPRPRLQKNSASVQDFDEPGGRADVVRVQVEAARTRQAITPRARSPEGDAAHISRLTIGLAAIKRSAAPLMPHGGVGIGLYHATFDRAPTTGWRRGGYLRGGIEVQVTDALAVDGEGGLHVVPQSLYPGGELRGELVLRVKFGL